MMNLTSARRAVAAAVALTLLASAPGFPAYAAAAAVVSVEAGALSAGPRVSPVPLSAGLSAAPLNAAPLTAPSLMAGPNVSAAPSASLFVPAGAAVSARPVAALPAAVPVAAALPVAAAAPAASVSVAAAAAAKPSTISSAHAEVSRALEAAGDLTAAAPSGLHELGARLEAALTGAPALSASGVVAAPSMGEFGDLSSNNNQLARPAGDMIRQAAEAASDGPAAPPTPPSPAKKPTGPKGPFWPKLVAAGLALTPAYFLGLPLIAAGSVVLGGLVIASGVSLAVMPFLGENAPKALRALPGAALGAVGVAAAVSGFVVPGAFAAVGGWGLLRYGLGKSELPRYESVESLTAYFGGVAALSVAALAAVSPAGWLALGARFVAYPLSALLWLHLPSWVGHGMAGVFQGAWMSIKGVSRVTSAVRRDTVLLDRLERFSERHWERSKWNAVWLSLIWTPVLLIEAAKWLVAGLAGLYAGAVQAPVMFLWGASYKLFGAGRATAYFAEAARFVFDHVQNGKAGLFNKAEARVLPFANSDSLARRALGALGMNVLLLGWLAYVAVGTPLLSVAGLLMAFGRMGAYDQKRHDPSSLEVSREDSPGSKPTGPSEPTEPAPAKALVAPKLIATALALAPAVYFGWPLLLTTPLFHAVGILYAVLALSLALMPFMGARTPKLLTSLPGRAMVWNGLALVLSGHAILAGVLAALGGWGFERWAAARNADKARFDDSAELGAFFGALGASVAVGAAWLGLAGTWGWAALGFAAVTSPFLLMHLPEWVWSGMRGFFREPERSVGAYADVLGFWRDDTKFMSNLRRHADFWLQRTYWNGVWLSVIWVPTGLIAAAEYVLSLALGLATGLVRAPLGFVAAAYKNAQPRSRKAAFFGAAVDGWRAAAEGSKGFFDKLVAPLKPSIDQASAVSGRPTAKAALALLAARVLQLAWLVGVAAMTVSGAAFVYGLIRGAKAAAAVADAPKA